MRYRIPFPIPTDDHPVESEGDVRLPAELDSLGRQLSREAQQLAARHAARSPSRRHVTPLAARNRRSFNRRRVLGALAIPVSIAATVTICLLLPRTQAPIRQAATNAPTAESPGSVALNRDAEPLPLRYVNEPSSETGLTIVPVATMRDAELLQNVSGPELEGLLDLWEQDETGKTSVSI